MESALSIPEILDNILLLSEPSVQAATAQTCQHWNYRSSLWLWRDMTSFYPLLELLSGLVYRNGAWEFTSKPSDVNWERFDRYAGHVRSIYYDQATPFRGYRGLLLDQALEGMFLHRPTSNVSVLPNLARVHWKAKDRQGLTQLLTFLVPTITVLQLNCKGPLENACVGVLQALTPRKIFLTDLKMAMTSHTPAFLEKLSDVLAHQRRLIRVALPYYSASQNIVTTLGTLPCLEEYGSWTFIEYQVPRMIGMEFDWKQGAFMFLKTFGLITSLADMARVMSRPHQPHLDDLTLTSRDFLEHIHLHNLCSSLSTFQPSLTVLYLSLYSDTIDRDTSPQVLPFNLLRPLLLCTALREVCIRSGVAMEHNDEDIVSMANGWPNLEKLTLCADPASDIGLAVGQPLRSVGTFTQNFCALQELSLYVNTLDIDATPGIATRSSQSRLTVLDFGTSPIPIGSTGSPDILTAIYVAPLLEPHAKIKSERGGGHKRFVPTSLTAMMEYSRREEFWFSFATEVYIILSGTTSPKQR
ncbi:hypothetical protein FRB96_002502 [Tulasnella sp. 330]|nr:hypothetical protein FRB96_002502 [Tulasnella sp. 330]